jgi:hypothetical protein
MSDNFCTSSTATMMLLLLLLATCCCCLLAVCPPSVLHLSLLLHTTRCATHLGTGFTANMLLLLWATCCCCLLALRPPSVLHVATAARKMTMRHTPWHQLHCHHAVALLICAHPHIAFSALQRTKPAAPQQNSNTAGVDTQVCATPQFAHVQLSCCQLAPLYCNSCCLVWTYDGCAAVELATVCSATQVVDFRQQFPHISLHPGRRHLIVAAAMAVLLCVITS